MTIHSGFQPDASEVERLGHVIEAAVLGDPWHGSSLQEILDEITPGAAAARPIANGHTIWEISLHMTAWTREVARRLRGADPASPPEGDWPDPTPSAASPAGDAAGRDWAQAVGDLQAVHADLRAALAAMQTDRLYRHPSETRDARLGTGKTCYEMVIGVLQHDAYHSGQIALLRKLTAIGS